MISHTVKTNGVIMGEGGGVGLGETRTHVGDDCVAVMFGHKVLHF